MRQMALLALAIIALAFAAVGANSAHAADLTLSGEVTYRERMALPEPANLSVRLVDLTRDGAPATVEAEAILPATGQVPLTFTLTFADSIVTAGHAYGLVAEITSGETVFFRNQEPVPVEPAAGLPVTVLVQFLGASGEATTSTLEVAASPSLLDLTWELHSIMGVETALPTTLAISGDLRAGGKGPCNSYFASVELGDGTVAFGGIAATRMACSVRVMSAEQAFFGALERSRAYAIDGDRLTLSDDKGTALLTFKRSAP